MRKTIENEYLKAEVSDLGAQLCGLYDKEKGQQVIWEADRKYWGYHAPILFPFVGNVNGGSYRYKGQEYTIGQHGFARQSGFSFVSRTPDSVTFRLKDSERTRSMYPFAFRLEVKQTLEGRSLITQWKVTNPSVDEPLYFSIGAHPAFKVPTRYAGGEKNEYWIHFAQKDPEYILVDLENGGADTAKTYKMETEDGYLKLTDHLFDIDTFIFENGQIEELSLCYPDKTPYVTVHSKGFPNYGVWTKSDQAPFVCLEPWYGRLDDKGFDGELPEKTGIIKLEPGETFTASWSIEVH